MTRDKFTIFIDGACEPVNPGGTMGFGVAILDGDRDVWACSGIAPHPDKTSSSNLAEYAALLAALCWLLDSGHRDRQIEILSDSKMLVEQMCGRWQIGRGHYIKAALEAHKLAAGFPDLTFRWIPRERNSRADALSKAALIKAGVTIRPEPSRSASARAA
jgi:ribonuclease HI